MLLATAAASTPVATALLNTSVVPLGKTESRRAVNSTVADCPAATEPRLHSTLPPDDTPPSVADSNVVRGGSASVSVTIEAAADPTFE